jgi:hypothetical protein
LSNLRQAAGIRLPSIKEISLRKFGLEVEYVGSRNRTADECRAVGLPVSASSSHLGSDDRQWISKPDGSVAGGGDRGCELVSPPLDFDTPADREQVNRAFAALQIAGAATDASAGIHVHVDASDLTAAQVANVGRFFAKFEDQIYRIGSSGWQQIRQSGINNYCKPMDFELIRRLTRVRDQDGFYRAWYGSVSAGRSARTDHYHGSRYHGLNLHSWCYRGTIEFRIFNSTLNAERAQAYIALCVAIVQDAREGFRRSTGKSFVLGSMANGTVKPESALLRLQQVLRTNSKDTKILMSKEDWKLIRKCWKDSVAQEAPPSWLVPR